MDLSARGVVCELQHLAGRTSIQPSTGRIDLNTLGKVGVLHDHGPEPTVAAGLVLCERCDSQPALDDKEVLMSVKCNTAGGRQVGEDRCCSEACGGGHGRAKCESVVRRALGAGAYCVGEAMNEDSGE